MCDNAVDSYLLALKWLKWLNNCAVFSDDYIVFGDLDIILLNLLTKHRS